MRVRERQAVTLQAVTLLVLTLAACGSGTSGQSAAGAPPESSQVSVAATTSANPSAPPVTSAPPPTSVPPAISAPPVTSRPPRSSAAVPTSGPASASRTAGPSVDVGEADNGTRVRLRSGQRLRLTLSPDYQPVSVSDPRLLRTGTETGGFPTGQPLLTVLVVAAPGEVTLTSSSDATCLHATPPCALPQRLWMLKVSIDR